MTPLLTGGIVTAITAIGFYFIYKCLEVKQMEKQEAKYRIKHVLRTLLTQGVPPEDIANLVCEASSELAEEDIKALNNN